tara:strand:- start:982 stop:1128 length:147 start_codon:yes stop_codon:yes gene_type:complete
MALCKHNVHEVKKRMGKERYTEGASRMGEAAELSKATKWWTTMEESLR